MLTSIHALDLCGITEIKRQCKWKKDQKVLTTQAKINETTENEHPKPSWSLIAMVSVVTVAKWKDDIPSDPRSCLKSQMLTAKRPDTH